MLRLLLWIAVIGLFILFGSTVNLGHRTLFGHIGNIWSSKEAGEMKDDVKEGSKPALEKIERAGKAAVEELKSEPARDAGAAAPRPAPRRQPQPGAGSP